MTARAETEILNAFDSIHSLGVIHGDSRADNILVAEEGDAAWIIDFEFEEVIVEGFYERRLQTTQDTEVVKRLLAKHKIPSRPQVVCGNGAKHSQLGTEAAIIHV